MTSSRPRPRPVLRSPGAQAAALLALLALDVGPVLAQRGAIPAGAQTRLQEIRITASEGRLIRLPRPAGSIFLADPTIADLQTPNAASVFVFGKKPGRTTLYALDGAGVQIAAWRIIIAYSDAELRELLRAEVGNYPVSLAYTPNGGVLSGTVPTPQAAERVRAVAARFVGDGGVLVNNLTITGSLQVSLRVRVAEVRRSVAKQLGINWSAVAGSGNFTIGLLTGRAPLAVANTVLGAGSGAGSLFGSYSAGRSNATAVLDALATESIVQTLAEPTLVAISGETARFLAGGEFPVPVAQGLDRVSIDYRRFGVSLEFQPTVLSDDLISIKVSPEVSELSQTAAITANGFSVPGLSTRRVDTTVELASGQSFAIAGLLQNSFSNSVSRFPGLGDIPILGALFRSSQFNRDETELVVIVTPLIVRPATRDAALRLPATLVAPPTELERILFGRIGGAAGPQAPQGGTRLRGDAGFLLE